MGDLGPCVVKPVINDKLQFLIKATEILVSDWLSVDL